MLRLRLGSLDTQATPMPNRGDSVKVSRGSCSWSQVDRVSESAGIYAWYLTPVLWPADLDDLGQTVSNLESIANQLRLPTRRAKIAGDLSFLLEGDLEQRVIGGWDESGNDLVSNTLADDDDRHLFAQILEQTVPILAAPLYIGVTDNLRRRFREHKRDFLKYRKRLRLDATQFDHDPAASLSSVRAQRFAYEVARRGMKFSDMDVHYLELELSDKQRVRRVVEAVETILNRLFFPILGKR